jgi:hypothetical protein
MSTKNRYKDSYVYLYIPLTGESDLHITCPNYLNWTATLDMFRLIEDWAHRILPMFQPAGCEYQILLPLVTASILAYNGIEYRAESYNLNLFYTDPRILYCLEDCGITFSLIHNSVTVTVYFLYNQTYTFQ